ncbi:MAG: polysaccharide deacetylase family protein [Devosia sp.]|nr:polysaccharide deacetylase family protein [Devosia sp.]
MVVLRLLVCMLVLGMGVAGCAKAPERHELRLTTSESRLMDAGTTGAIGAVGPFEADQPMPPVIAPLAGRTLAVGKSTDLMLRPGEVVLSFDDGPRVGKTRAILDALDAYGVKGVFFMVGQSALANPKIVQEVALRGHAIGTHTHDHGDLSELTRPEALAAIAKGEQEVAAALAPIGLHPDPFFRFPYLSSTSFLRASLALEDRVIFGVQIDSSDYWDSTPAEVLNRTLARLDAAGGGIILFHDTHERTVAMLPDFLKALAERGYEVVSVVPTSDALFDRPLQVADSGFLRGGY